MNPDAKNDTAAAVLSRFLRLLAKHERQAVTREHLTHDHCCRGGPAARKRARKAALATRTRQRKAAKGK